MDLGFVNATQALQHQKAPSTIDELVTHVQEAYWEQPTKTVNSIFLTLQKVMESIMVEEGRNTFKLPHMGKEHLSRIGRLPLTTVCSQDAIDSALQKMGEAI